VLELLVPLVVSAPEPPQPMSAVMPAIKTGAIGPNEKKTLVFSMNRSPGVV
jgi:hypothetical protein